MKFVTDYWYVMGIYAIGLLCGYAFGILHAIGHKFELLPRFYKWLLRTLDPSVDINNQSYNRLYKLLMDLKDQSKYTYELSNGDTCHITYKDWYTSRIKLVLDTSSHKTLEIEFDTKRKQITKLQYDFPSSTQAFELVTYLETAIASKQGKDRDLLTMLAAGGN